MVSNFACALTIFMAVCAVTYAEDYKKYKNEQRCLQAGGFCMPTDECPVEVESEYKELCPEGRKENPSVECCHGISLKETQCRKFGGECMQECPKELTVSRAKDCSDDTVCCVLV